MHGFTILLLEAVWPSKSMMMLAATSEQKKKGIRQGDPLSPILFNIMMDMLAIMIERAKNSDQIAGVVLHLVDGGISIL